MSKLTKEREAEIRSRLKEHDECKFIDDPEYLEHADEFRELLVEIDALRDELDTKDWNGQYWKDLEKERDELKAENEKLKFDLELAIAHDRQPYPTAEAYELACKNREKLRDERDQLKAENEKLRSRIEKLRDGLDKIAGDRLCECCDNGIISMPCTCWYFNPINCATEALVQDDIDSTPKSIHSGKDVSDEKERG